MRAARLALSALLAAGCGEGESTSAVAAPPLAPLVPDASVGTAAAPKSIILLVLDTLRADHTSVHGYYRPTTPFLQELAARGIVFERAYANASWTRASMATLFSSRLPESHGCEGRDGVLPAEVTTLAEVLDAAGFDTVGVTANGNLIAGFGFGQGFDTYRFVLNKGNPALHEPPYANALKLEKPLHEAAQTLSPERPFLFYVQYVDPHDPYFPHPETDFDPGYAGDFVGARDQLKPFARQRPPEEIVQRARELYDGAILWLDRYLLRLITRLGERGLLADAWIVVTSDHGEGLWTHETQAHGGEVFEEQLHVPLIVVPPGGLQHGVRIAQPIALLDLAPTLLELAGVPPSPAFAGRSWGAFLRGLEAAPLRPVVVDEDLGPVDLSAIIDGQRKLIIDDATRRMYAFDLATNPGEDPSRAVKPRDAEWSGYEDLVAQLREALRQAGQWRADATAAPELSDDVREHLEAIGYLGDHDEDGGH